VHSALFGDAPGERRAWWQGLDQLQTITKRITQLESIVARNRDSVAKLNSSGRQPLAPAVDIRDPVRDMRLGRPAVDTVLDSYVYLAVAHLEPETAAIIQIVGFVDLTETQQPAIESAPFRRPLARQ
jgi:hypothetical protein